MSEWKEYKLGDIAEITSSKRIFYSEYVENGVPFYRSKEIIDLFNRRDIQTELYITEKRFKEIEEKFGVPMADDILLTSVGSLGVPYKVKPKDKFYFKDGNLTWFRNLDKSKVIPDFLFTWISSNVGKQKLDEVSIGSTQAALTISGLKTIEILLPDLKTQTAIASILSSLDDKIDLLHRQNATLEKMAETLFRQWFVEPIKKIANEGTEVEGFSNSKFGKWIKETVGGEWGKENSEGDFNKVVYCIRGTDIADLNTGLPEKTPIRFVKPAKFKNIEPLEGDLILEISGGTESQSTGRVCYINQDVKRLFKHPLVFSNFCRMIRVKKSEYSFFLYCYIQYLYNQDEFFNLENGSSGIKNLDYKALLFELDYPMPNENLVLDFHLQVEPLFKKVNQNKKQIRTLIALRDTLLPKLMSGEIRVGQ